MNANKKDIKTIVAAANKMVEKKENLIKYSKGEISKKDLNERGVKPVMPL